MIDQCYKSTQSIFYLVYSMVSNGVYDFQKGKFPPKYCSRVTRKWYFWESMLHYLPIQFLIHTCRLNHMYINHNGNICFIQAATYFFCKLEVLISDLIYVIKRALRHCGKPQTSIIQRLFALACPRCTS